MHVGIPLRRAVAVGAAVLGVAGAAAAAEITLYEHARFGGERITLRGSTSDMSGSGFNDRASSIVVNSGRWQVCSESNFRGTCTVLTRGQYASLPNLNDKISSVRETGGDSRSGYRDPDDRGSRGDGYRDGRRDDDRRGDRRDDRRGDRSGDGSLRGGSGIDLFSDPAYRGQRLRIESDVEDLTRANFNDRAASMVIFSGNWELCTNAGFGGDCTAFGPGRYVDLGPLSRGISSVRRVR
jgi:hypothetical protein